jgi:hypothetical protein
MPSPEEMAASGFSADDYEADPVDLWPENARLRRHQIAPSDTVNAAHGE